MSTKQPGFKRWSGLALIFSAMIGWSSHGAVDQTVADLIPKLAAEKVEDRYAAQMELQRMALSAGRPEAEAERSDLAKALASKAGDAAVPQPARVWIIRQLEYIGASESVTALTKVLHDSDAELRESARRALEKNGAPAASDSLRAALKQATDTSWQIGLINSLGERHDAAAVDLIKPHAKSKATSVAALSALAKIASDSALESLWSAYDDSMAGADDALVAGGNRLQTLGRKPQAGTLFERLYFAGTTNSANKAREKKEPPAQVEVRCAALVGLSMANSSRAGHLIKDALQGKDTRLQFAAVTAAVNAYGKAVSSALAPLLAKAPATTKTYILPVLDSSAEPRVIPLATDTDETVRVAAIETLGKIGGEASVPVLLKAAVEGTGATQKAGTAALAKVCGTGADAAIAKAAAEGDSKSRAVAIRALADRNDRTSVPSLIKYAPQSDAKVSAAAYAALGRLATDQEIEALGQLVLSGKSPGAEDALQAVVTRSQDKSKAGLILAGLMGQRAEPQGLAALLKVMPALGGSAGLNAVSPAASSSDAQVKDAAIRALANWPDFAATKVLLKIARADDTTQVQNVVAIQGIVRLIKSSDHEPAASRLEAAQGAWTAARRNEEKKLIVSALASIPLAASADTLKPLLSDATFKTEACMAAVSLSEALLKTDKPAAKSLAQSVKDANPTAELVRKADAVLKK